MVTVAFLIMVAAANSALFFYFRRAFEEGPAWRAISLAAMTFAGVRLMAVGSGTYLLWNSAGPAQILGAFLVYAGLPEIALAGRQQPGAAGLWLITALAAVAAGSLLWVIMVGSIAFKIHRHKRQRPINTIG